MGPRYTEVGEPPLWWGYACPECGAAMDPYDTDMRAQYYVCPECNCLARVERNRRGTEIGDLDLIRKQFEIPFFDRFGQDARRFMRESGRMNE